MLDLCIEDVVRKESPLKDDTCHAEWSFLFPTLPTVFTVRNQAVWTCFFSAESSMQSLAGPHFDNLSARLISENHQRYSLYRVDMQLDLRIVNIFDKDLEKLLQIPLSSFSTLYSNSLLNTVSAKLNMHQTLRSPSTLGNARNIFTVQYFQERHEGKRTRVGP
jgi:hypothetical protein